MSPTSVADWAQQDAPGPLLACDHHLPWPRRAGGQHRRARREHLDQRVRPVRQHHPHPVGGQPGLRHRKHLHPAGRDASPDHAAKARVLDSHTIYSADGLDALESFGPLHTVKLASGDLAVAREHTLTSYDQNPPTGGPDHLPTTSQTGAWIPGQSSDTDVRVTSTGYDDPDKPTSNDPASDYRVGWKLRQPITTTTDPGSAPHLDLKSITRYDKTPGLVIETRMPANPAGGDAHSSKTIYYTGDTSSGDSACNSKPQFANLACKTLPAAQPGTTGLSNLPVTQTSYNRYNQPTTVTETVGTTTRTTTTSYDTAGRTTDLAIASTADASGTATIIRGYDTLGRLTSYQDADSTSPATTTYDLLDRPATVSDGKGTQTLTYDTSIDPRGLATSLADSAVGTFTARYDPDGNLVTQGYPNGMEARTTYDKAGNEVELAYVKTSNGTADCTWLDFQTNQSIHDQILDQGSSLSGQDYTYDAAGRLTQVQDTPTGAGCTIRSYGYDPDSNRLSLNTKPPAADGTCDTAATGTTTSHTYDPADRITDSGFAYDTFGRITTVPAAAAGTTGDITASYYTSDMVRALTQAGTTHTWTLDPNRRLRGRTDSGGSTGTRTNHYADDTDAPAWIAEDATATHWTRNISAFGSDLVAIQDSAAGTTLQLADLHGDTVATASLDPAATGLRGTFEATEFGIPRSGTSPRYGWLGAKQRETDDLTGVMLMGVRLYVPAMGRFLQVDPVAGGSANDYASAAQAPINAFDLDGKW